MNKLLLIALFGAVAVSAADNEAPEPKPTPGPPVPLAPTPVVCPTDRAQCSDDHDSCHSWAWLEFSNGGKTQKKIYPSDGKSQCTLNPSYMLKRCTLSCCSICQTCPGENRSTGNNKRGVSITNKWPYTATATTANKNPERTGENLSQCVKDKHALCRQWADEGECHEYRDPAKFGTIAEINPQAKWMHENCNSACCPGCAQSCPSSRDMCTNDYGSDSSCVRWSRAGECSANPVWMNENCARECCPVCRPQADPAPAYVPQRMAYQPQPYQQYGFNGYRNNVYGANPYGLYNPYGR